MELRLVKTKQSGKKKPDKNGVKSNKTCKITFEGPLVAVASASV